MLPRMFETGTLLENVSFAEQMRDMAGRVEVISYFQMMHYRTYLPSAQELDAIGNFTLVYAGRDAAIWVRSELVKFE